MGLFRRKTDPISERAKLLNQQIAALEAEIQKLNGQQEMETTEEKSLPNPSPFAAATRSVSSVPSTVSAHPAAPAPGQPRLRSTALPHSQGVVAPSPVPPTSTVPAPSVHEPIFEEVDEDRLQDQEVPGAPAPGNELGVRKYDLTSAWQRVKVQFRGPVTSNPKLVHYLSAGSIQGLRPLRYEKRVARNRVIVLAAFLLLALWGIIAIFVSRR